MERAALRLFFVPIARCQRCHASPADTRHDRHFQPANWQPLITFEQACGLRRSELARLTVADVYPDELGALVVHVLSGKGAKSAR